MPKSPILIIDSLTKIFEPRGLFIRKQQNFKAVDTVSFSVGEGEIIGILGPNGCGKTTTIHMLLGTITPTSGYIEYFGKNFSTHQSEILQKVGFASSYFKLAPRLTIFENLDIFARIYGLDRDKRIESITKLLKFFDIWNSKDKEVGTLSAGQTTRVMLIKAFVAEPLIVLLDEPTASLDPDIATEIRQFILEQRNQKNCSILIASHNMEEVNRICDRALIMKQGKILANTTLAQLALEKTNLEQYFLSLTRNAAPGGQTYCL